MLLMLVIKVQQIDQNSMDYKEQDTKPMNLYFFRGNAICVIIGHHLKNVNSKFLNISRIIIYPYQLDHRQIDDHFYIL